MIVKTEHISLRRPISNNKAISRNSH